MPDSVNAIASLRPSAFNPLLDRITGLLLTGILTTNRYVVVKGYLEDLISRIARIRHEVISAALTGFSSSSIYREATIGTAAECYMDQNLFDSVYPAVAESCSDDSLKWNAALGRARMADDKAFGVRQEFLCDFSPAVASISPLVKCRTPFDMFTTIKETFQVINSCVAANLRYLRIEGESMTTDDLLPIVALILVRAAEPELVSLMEYTNRFGGSTTGISEFAFNHVTLEAAVAFIQSADFQKTLPLAQLPVTVPGQKDSDTRRRSYFEAIKHEHSAFPTSRPVDCQYGGRGDSRVMQERADSGNVGQDLNGVSVGSSALQELAGGQSIRPAYGIDAVGVAEKQAEAFLELQPNSSYDELLAHLRVSTTTNANQQFAMDVLAVIDDVYQCHVEALEATGRSTRPGDRNLVANRPREQSSRESGDAPENAFSPKVVAQTIATDDATATKEDMGDFLSALAQGW